MRAEALDGWPIATLRGVGLLLAIAALCAPALHAEEDDLPDELVRQLAEADADDREDLAIKIKEAGPQAAPALLTLARHRDAQIRGFVSTILAGWAAAAWHEDAAQKALEAKKTPPIPANLKDTVEVLGQLLDDPAESVRAKAAGACEYYGPWAAPLVPALVKALGDPDGGVAKEALRAFEQVGPVALPDLVGTLADGPARKDIVRNRALIAIARIKPLDAPTLLAVAKLLDHPDLGLRARTVLEAAAPGAAPEAAEAAVKLADATPALRWPAAWLLGRMGAGKAHAETLKGWLKDPEPLAQAYAAAALVRQKPEAESAAERKLLLDGLDAEDRGKRRAFTRAAGDLGKRGLFAADALTWLLGDPDGEIRRLARLGLVLQGHRGADRDILRRKTFELRPIDWKPKDDKPDEPQVPDMEQ